MSSDGRREPFGVRTGVRTGVDGHGESDTGVWPFALLNPLCAAPFGDAKPFAIADAVRMFMMPGLPLPTPTCRFGDGLGVTSTSSAKTLDFKLSRTRRGFSAGAPNRRC